jgi:uncharacterized protein
MPPFDFQRVTHGMNIIHEHPSYKKKCTMRRIDSKVMSTDRALETLRLLC